MKDNHDDLKKRVRNFWDAYPCAQNVISSKEGSKAFFIEHDLLLDKLVPYAQEMFGYKECMGKRVLEIGCGMGSHALRQAKYTKEFCAIDFSRKSVELTRKRFSLFGHDFTRIFVGDAENLSFRDNFFDRVFSNGVIHHTPDTAKAVREIHRVLKPDGEAIIMLYHKNSLFYYYDLMTKNRIKYGLVKLIPEFVARTLRNRWAKCYKLWSELKKVSWWNLSAYAINVSDGRYNPHTKVFTKTEVLELFRIFKKTELNVRSSMDRLESRLPSLEIRLGWSLIIHAVK